MVNTSSSSFNLVREFNVACCKVLNCLGCQINKFQIEILYFSSVC